MTGSSDAVMAMVKLLETMTDAAQLRKLCLRLAQEAATTREEEIKLWVIIHELQRENQELQVQLLLERDADK